MDLRNTVEGERLAECLLPLARQAEHLNLPWLLIGAEARDLTLARYEASASPRRTYDVDAAVQLAGWDEFEALRDRLVKTESARVDAANLHRLTLPNDTQIDVVPFGPIAEHNKLHWPTSEVRSFDVTGLIEAHANAFDVQLTDGFSVRVPELELLICLKLFAWRDRHFDRPDHDSRDLVDLLQCIEHAIDDTLLYEDHFDVLERNDHDPELAKIELCGVRLGRQLSNEARRSLTELLERETDEEGRLALVRELRDLHRALDRLAALMRGVAGPTGSPPV